MKSAPIAELKASLSRYLAGVKAGEDLLVTERGKPKARLTRAEAESVLERLVREGRATPPSEPHGTLPPPVRLPGGISLSDIIVQERRKSRY
jgi:prevent-host-death family protein